MVFPKVCWDLINTTCNHQSSMEGLIDFSAAEPLFANEQERTQAGGRFCHARWQFVIAQRVGKRSDKARGRLNLDACSRRLVATQWGAGGHAGLVR